MSGITQKDLYEALNGIKKQLDGMESKWNEKYTELAIKVNTLETKAKVWGAMAAFIGMLLLKGLDYLMK